MQPEVVGHELERKHAGKQTPMVMRTGQRFGLNVISAVSAQGLLRFMVVRGRVAAAQAQPCRSGLGGTCHWPVRSGYQPDRRTHAALTKWGAVSVRPARRQLAAANGQVGRSTQSNCIVPAQACEFLRGLVHGARRPVFLILGGHPMHKAKEVDECVANPGGKQRLLFLPPCSPELNPDEQVWRNLKTTGIGRGEILDHEDLEAKVARHLATCAVCPGRFAPSSRCR